VPTKISRLESRRALAKPVSKEAVLGDIGDLSEDEDSDAKAASDSPDLVSTIYYATATTHNNCY
jgi:hypothetical protein